jgi:hypothetical protein
MKFVALMVVTALAMCLAAACGSSTSPTTHVAQSNNSTTHTPSTPSDQEQVRSLYGKVLTVMASNDPSSICQYYRPQEMDNCIGTLFAAKEMGVSLKSMVSYGWQKRLAKAKIVVKGDKAVIIGRVAGTGKEKGDNSFTRIDGIWYKDGDWPKDQDKS